MVKGIKPSPPRQIVNKGSWTEEEDQILSNYISIHGDKKWRSVPAKAGLNRCGKSCRLRWLNYLRPGIIRGNISEDEEDLIIRLHNLLGNSISLPIDGHRISLPIDGHRISLPNCAIQGDAVQFTRIMAFKKYNRTPRELGIHENQLLNQRVQYLQIKNCLPDENRTDHLSNIWKRWWSLIAGRLPGRTDNEIKNHWNTHLSKKSLSITDLNMKQNQNLEANPKLFPPMASARIQVSPETKPDMDEISRRQDNFPSTKNAEISKPWSQLLETDLATDRNQFVDVDEFFNFQESDMPETNTLSGEESRIREEQPQFKEFRVDEIYQNLLNDELLGSSDGCSEEQNKYEPLDLDSWAKLLDYDGNDDMLISFS